MSSASCFLKISIKCNGVPASLKPSLFTGKDALLSFIMGFASGLLFFLTEAALSIWLIEAGVSLTAIGVFSIVGTTYNF